MATKKVSRNSEDFTILIFKKLLSEFFVFIHELINSTCRVN